MSNKKIDINPDLLNIGGSSKTRKNREKGCTSPMDGKKARCILNIVPQNEKGQSIQIDKKCMKRRDE